MGNAATDNGCPTVEFICTVNLQIKYILLNMTIPRKQVFAGYSYKVYARYKWLITLPLSTIRADCSKRKPLRHCRRRTT